MYSVPLHYYSYHFTSKTGQVLSHQVNIFICYIISLLIPSNHHFQNYCEHFFFIDFIMIIMLQLILKIYHTYCHLICYFGGIRLIVQILLRKGRSNQLCAIKLLWKVRRWYTKLTSGLWICVSPLATRLDDVFCAQLGSSAGASGHGMFSAKACLFVYKRCCKYCSAVAHMHARSVCVCGQLQTL